MPRCAVCNGFFPPFLAEKTDDGKAHKCQFCIRDTKEIQYVKNDKLHKLTREEVIKEYKLYINKLSMDNDVINKIITGQKPEE